jgi:hypothetical protein
VAWPWTSALQTLSHLLLTANLTQIKLSIDEKADRKVKGLVQGHSTEWPVGIQGQVSTLQSLDIGHDSQLSPGHRPVQAAFLLKASMGMG